MLSEILSLLSEGKTLTQYELAERLNTTPEAITTRIAFLQQAGYLKRVCFTKDCSKKCAGCTAKDAAIGNIPTLFEVTNKNIASERISAT